VTIPTGMVLGKRYRVLSPLGAGGMATTYCVFDLVEQREVALKLLSGRELESAFLAEFERLRGLSHPHLTRVHALGRDIIEGERRIFYTADLIVGGTLGAQARADFDALLPAIVDALDALSFLHALGLRHGDVKPDNILCTPDGRGVLIDLGCARVLSTASPAIDGTPGYMAPEVLAGDVADERADLYAVGVMLRELGARGPILPLIARLTAPSASDRPSSVAEVLAALGQRRVESFVPLAPVVRMVGRDHEHTEVVRACARVTTREQGPRTVWIHGAPGVGRSRFLREVCWDLSAGASVHEVPADPAGGLRDVLARISGTTLAPGAEGILAAVSALTAMPDGCFISIDQSERLDIAGQRDLATLMRALSVDGGVGLLVASTQPPVAADAIFPLALAPLPVAALEEWSHGTLPSHAMAALLSYTGGYPAYVTRVLDAVRAGRLRLSDLRAGHVAEAKRGMDPHSDGAFESMIRSLSVQDQATLVRLALQADLGGVTLASDTSDIGPSAHLFALQMVRREGREVVLARKADRERVLVACPKELVDKHRVQMLRLLAKDPSVEALGARLVLLCDARKWREATALFERRSDVLSTPQAFLPFVQKGESKLAPKAAVLAASIARACAEPALALRYLARARRAKPDPALLSALHQEAAEVYLTLGKLKRAERISRAWGDAARSEVGLVELRCRCLLRVASYEPAAELAKAALATEHAKSQRASLLEDLATAEAYLGRLVDALAHIAEAAELHRGEAPRAQARCLAFLAFVAHRAGDAARAAESAERVRELAEQHGFDDLLVNALTTLGTAREVQGNLGTAFDHYERGLRLSLVLGRLGSVRTLRANLANLALELGLFERARIDLGWLLADRGLSPALVHTIRCYEAELHLLCGRSEEAEASLHALVLELDQRGAVREACEARALLALSQSYLGKIDESRELSQKAIAQADALAIPDLCARVTLLAGRVAERNGTGQAMLSRIESELKRASSEGLELLVAGLHTLLFQICETASLQALAREHRERARSLWERISLDVPSSTRDAFWAHPWRAPLRREASEPMRPRGRSTFNLQRIFEVNRRLNSSHSVRGVLDYAIDAATEITSAERGFVLLQRPDRAGFDVAVARNLDRKRLLGDELKLSRSIAERVITDDEPLLTLDAGADTRFAQHASVHAMRLKSVLCVPIRSPNGVLGALYLDTRLERARFERSDLELLLGFADQVAVALTNARLVSELEHRTRELAKQKQRVEALSAGQAEEIARLAGELDKRQEALESRYDYSQIVGHSEPMRRVLHVLDRVLDSDLSVLIQGESGTGKELVARAIHFNSQRKSRAFLGLNCAALPENLIESELFGVVKGAFTGADRDKPGLFVSATGGTLFLDELQELTLATQAKLLRVLQDREVRPVGGTRSIPIDVRIVSATNRDLSQRVKEGAFREDLFYRLAVVDVTLPPLRARAEDILPIAEAILARRSLENGGDKRTLSPDAVRALLAHGWPGNVRELENTLLRASVMAEGPRITARDLGLVRGVPTATPRVRSRKDYEEHEAERLLSLLESQRWNVSRVAKSLGMPRNTLYRKLARYGIERRV